jgi:hypothetical protein
MMWVIPDRADGPTEGLRFGEPHRLRFGQITRPGITQVEEGTKLSQRPPPAP